MFIYISGRITGNDNYMCDFMNAELKLKDNFPRAKIINPINTTGCNSWAEYMRKDLTLLLKCDTIYMLEGWEVSEGASLEHYIANKLGLKIIYETK